MEFRRVRQSAAALFATTIIATGMPGVVQGQEAAEEQGVAERKDRRTGSASASVDRRIPYNAANARKAPLQSRWISMDASLVERAYSRLGDRRAMGNLASALLHCSYKTLSGRFKTRRRAL